MKVMVAMSGGVDSSVAALILKKDGFDVVGASMDLFSCQRKKTVGCCSASDRHDARRVCEQICVPYHVFDLREKFRKSVIDEFVDEYLRGRTPSPCILCNEHLKFGAFIDEAAKSGAKKVATGHYARIVEEGGRYRLLRGVDPSKDQSYFLFTLKQSQLGKLIFPVGAMTKNEVRAFARENHIATTEKPESQEVCFVPDDYAAFIEEHAGKRLLGPGDFVDVNGKKIARHRGIHAYTIGQRRGLGFGMGKRQYVLRIDAERNEVVLGDESFLSRDEITVSRVSWVSGEPAFGRTLSVKIRSQHPGEDAVLHETDSGHVKVGFKKPVKAVAAGQAAVFYDGDEVVGGGWIEDS